MLALLTVANFAMRDPTSAEQIRFVAAGQDPNDVARFLDLGLPVAALLLDGRERWPGRLLAVGYIPLGFACVLLTASRSGFLVALVALAGCAMILFQRNSRALMVGSLMLPALAIAVWLAAPQETLARLGTIVEQLQNADLNRRVSIWSAGWRAFLNAPLFGHGAGSFVFAASLAAEDTAHNTILAVLVEGGMFALAIASAIVAVSMKAVTATTRVLRIALTTLMAVWLVSSLAGTVGESRMTWLLFGAVAVVGRFAENDAEGMERVFPSFVEFDDVEPVTELK